jgi:hypothetical protein
MEHDGTVVRGEGQQEGPLGTIRAFLPFMPIDDTQHRFGVQQTSATGTVMLHRRCNGESLATKWYTEKHNLRMVKSKELLMAVRTLHLDWLDIDTKRPMTSLPHVMPIASDEHVVRPRPWLAVSAMSGMILDGIGTKQQQQHQSSGRDSWLPAGPGS